MKLDTIHHVALICSDYQASRHFYVDLLGFEIIRENYREARGDYKLDLRLGDCELELFAIPGSPARPSYPEACGLRHLAFHVSCIEDTIRELNGLGIETEPVRIDEFTRKTMTLLRILTACPWNCTNTQHIVKKEGLCNSPSMKNALINFNGTIINFFLSLKPFQTAAGRTVVQVFAFPVKRRAPERLFFIHKAQRFLQKACIEAVGQRAAGIIH